MFGRLFGTNQQKKKAPPPNLNQSIQKLREASTQLEKREQHLEKKIAQCIANAKAKSKKRDKKGALFELKKKKMLENQLNGIQGKKLNLEIQIMALEDAHLNNSTLKAMKVSANAMKATIKDNDIDKADELMEDINDVMDQVQDMNDAMSQPLGQVIDDDELEDELAELEEMEADDLLMAMPNSPAVNTNPVAANTNTNATTDPNVASTLPAAPTGPIAANTDDDDLLALEQMMN